MKKLTAVTWAEEIEVRFAFSGKIASISKKSGDKVSKGQILASLDRYLLQRELDQKLANNKMVRSAFDLGKGDKAKLQTDLDTSVREVEEAKYRLDQADLYSPVNGIVKSAGGARPGLNITPASNSFVIVDVDSLVYRIRVSAKEVEKYMNRPKMPIPSAPGYFWVDVEIADKTNLLPGMEKTIEDNF